MTSPTPKSPARTQRLATRAPTFECVGSCCSDFATVSAGPLGSGEHMRPHLAAKTVVHRTSSRAPLGRCWEQGQRPDGSPRGCCKRTTICRRPSARGRRGGYQLRRGAHRRYRRRAETCGAIPFLPSATRLTSERGSVALRPWVSPGLPLFGQKEIRT